MMEEIEQDGNLIVDLGKEEKKKDKKGKSISSKRLKQLEDEKFEKEYQKIGGIQHIICSATLTIDNKGRITPRQSKLEKKRQLKEKVKKDKGYLGEKKGDDIQNTLD